MLADPPGITQADFLRVLDDVLRILSLDPPNLCASTPWTDRPDKNPDGLHSAARLTVQLEGRFCLTTSVRGHYTDIELNPGQSLYMVPNSWLIAHYDTLGRSFGVVIWPNRVRFIQSFLTGKPPTEWTPYAYHTALPLGGAGPHVLRALNCLAEEGTRGPAARDLFTSLLHLVRQHLADDAPATHTHGRAVQTWQGVQTYLQENFGRATNRESVAQALGLHPNYLSALARQAGGVSFTEVLEGVRMSQARRLLLDTDLKLARIATLCGYRDATRFGKVFRRLSGMTPGRFRGQIGKPR